MCDFWRMTPTVGAVWGFTPIDGACSLSYQVLYSVESSNTRGASGCQMPMSGRSTGSAMASAFTWLRPSYTYESAIMRRSDSRFSGEPPSQYWKESMKERASLALSDGRYLSTLGSVRRSLSMEPSKEAPFSWRFFFMNSPITDCDCPICAMVKLPTLFKRITSGIEGKINTASSFDRSGSTTSTTFSASSCTKMRDPMKMLADSTSRLKASSVSGLRSSSRR
mmetsp:Transcript_38127/g.78205  ORF Transcript_38127/g.78205 Transcript_38127/m.78205 type:complete len:223 (+) Transcript_38127:3381-4049(+)